MGIWQLGGDEKPEVSIIHYWSVPKIDLFNTFFLVDGLSQDRVKARVYLLVNILDQDSLARDDATLHGLLVGLAII